MNKQNSLTASLELIWWIVTLLVVVGVLFPIYTQVEGYPFWKFNIIFIIVFVTFSRYIFLLKHTFLAYRQKLKLVLFFLCIPLLFVLIENLTLFQTSLDEEVLDQLLEKYSLDKRRSLGGYIRSQMIFFSVGSIIATIAFMLRMMVSIWRTRNRGTA